MKTISLTVLFTFFASLVFGAEIFYPAEPLRNDPTEEGQALFPVNRDGPLASGNTVSVDYRPGENVVDPDSVFAGFAQTGTSENNKLTFKNGHVFRFVLGGFSLKGAVRKNSVVFSGGTVADAAIGKLCGGQTQDGDVEDNFVTISHGRIIGDVYGGDADADGNATGNQVRISGGELSGFVNSGGVSGVGIARKNRVEISGGSVAMGVSGGFAHAATALPPEQIDGKTEKKNENENEPKKTRTNSVVENIVKISGKAAINGNVSGGFVLDSTGSASNNTVDISGGVIRGNVYGGRAFSGEASGNTIIISGGTIKDRDNVVYAGYVHKPENGRATGNTMTLSGSPELKTITLYGNNLSTWKTDANTLNFKGFQGTVCGISHFQDIHIDRDSSVTVLGEGPHEIFNLHNQGRILFKSGKPSVLGKATGKPMEY